MVRDDDMRSRYRRDYTRERIQAVPTSTGLEDVHLPLSAPTLNTQPLAPSRPRRENRRKIKNKKRVLVVLILIMLGAVGGQYFAHRTKSPIPDTMAKAVNFPVYYPNQKELPAGYMLDTNSFQIPSPNVLVYSVIFPNERKLVFSLQQKPSAEEFANFSKQYLAVHHQVITRAGTATEGTVGQQTVVSLPTDASNVWIIITGPSNIYATANLAQVLKAITKDSI